MNVVRNIGVSCSSDRSADRWVTCVRVLSLWCHENDFERLKSLLFSAHSDHSDARLSVSSQMISDRPSMIQRSGEFVSEIIIAISFAVLLCLV